MVPVVQMIIDVEYLLKTCYAPCVQTYFGPDIFDTHPFLKEVYDTANNRGANVKAIYMFSDRHNFKTADAESFFLKYGMVLVPLFLPVNSMRYAEGCVISDAVLTMYSPMLVGIWKKATSHVDNLDLVDSRAVPTSSPSHAALLPVEIYVQRDCVALKEIRKRINDHLFKLTNLFRPMGDSIVSDVERTGKSTASNDW